MLGKRLAIGGDGFAADDFLDLAAPRQVMRLACLLDAGCQDGFLILCCHAVERAVGSQDAAPGIAGIQHLPVLRIAHHILDFVDDDRVDIAVLMPDLIIGVVRRDELIDAQNVVGHVLLFAADRRVLLELVLEFFHLTACRGEQALCNALVFRPEMLHCKMQSATAVRGAVFRGL